MLGVTRVQSALAGFESPPVAGQLPLHFAPRIINHS
jgi:hypothetical protein